MLDSSNFKDFADDHFKADEKMLIDCMVFSTVCKLHHGTQSTHPCFVWSFVSPVLLAYQNNLRGSALKEE